MSGVLLVSNVANAKDLNLTRNLQEIATHFNIENAKKYGPYTLVGSLGLYAIYKINKFKKANRDLSDRNLESENAFKALEKLGDARQKDLDQVLEKQEDLRNKESARLQAESDKRDRKIAELEAQLKDKDEERSEVASLLGEAEGRAAENERMAQERSWKGNTRTDSFKATRGTKRTR